MDLKDLTKPLSIDDIDFRIQSINKGGYATILAYKDARVDMQRLDEVCGPLNWKREHVNNNHNCIVSIWNDDIKEWIPKEDTGTESMTEKAKGLASDSFKRACFNWGIGRELYDYPLISIKLIKGVEWDLQNDRPKQLFGLKLKDWSWHSEFEGNKIIALRCIDQDNKVRFEWPKGNTQEKIAIDEMKATKTKAEITTIWNKYPSFQANTTEFYKVTAKQGKKVK